jgi:hypothetical protein
VLERNNHSSRDGHFVQPTLTHAVIPTLTPDAAFAANFDGAMWASPVYITNGPGGKGAFFVATTGNDVIALDETTGAPLWKAPYHLGDSPTTNGVNCGNIHPLGILSTPVIDPVTRTLYVAGAVGTTSILRHEVHAIDIETGKSVPGWPVDVTGMKSGNATFTPPPQNQRSALSLVGGKVYVAYGGHAGDCGNYHGWVIAIDTTDPTKRGAWATLGQGEAIWAPGGMASDGTSVFAVTGNSTVGAANRTVSDSESVVRVGGLAVMTRSDQNQYYPTTWRQMDGEDADFGASNPVYVTVPGSTPSGFVAAVAKDGQFYLLNAANLGGMGGHVATLAVANGAMSVKTSPTAYTTAKGVHVVLATEGNTACPGAPGSGQSMISVLLSAGSPPKASIEWCAPINGEGGPISTTTDGTANAAVWYLSGSKLTAVDGDTGKTLYTSANGCANVRRWTSPIAVKGRIVVGGDGHLCSWSAH